MRCHLGVIGNGFMVRTEHAPYLAKRIESSGDVEVRWVRGCLCSEKERKGCPHGKTGWNAPCKPGHAEDWRQLLENEPVDAVLVSLPNALHKEPIEAALSRGVHVTVDKPTTVSSEDCAALLRLAEEKDLIFVTQSQRRYEDVYQAIADHVRSGALGDIRLIQYMIAHEYLGREIRDWTTRKSLAGGGALISSGYHGIDTILWLLSLGPQGPVCARSVSAQWVVDDADDPIETLASVRITLTNDGIFNATASFESPRGSLDENIKIFGTQGAIRLLRDRPRKIDQSAAQLSFQHKSGTYAEYNTQGLAGMRWAPLEDFLNAVLARLSGKRKEVLSPARDSLQTIRVIEAAYESALHGGREIEI